MLCLWYAHDLLVVCAKDFCVMFLAMCMMINPYNWIYLAVLAYFIPKVKFNISLKSIIVGDGRNDTKCEKGKVTGRWCVDIASIGF